MRFEAQLVAPLAMAVAAALTARLVVPPRRPLSRRLLPYTALSRSRLGAGYVDAAFPHAVDPTMRPVPLRVLGPPLHSVARRLADLVDAGSDDQIALRLRQAGFSDTDPFQHRARQLAFAVGGLLLGGALGALVLRSLAGTLLLMVCFGFPAATFQRNRLNRAINERWARMRIEAYTVAQLLAVHLRTGRGPIEAVRAICAVGRGPLVAELRDALSWVSGGVAADEAYRRLADTTPEPAAARLFRLLAASAPSGGDVGRSLLAVADDLRSEQRDEVARRATRRRTAMLLPLLLLIAPVMLLFVGAALPALVLGDRR